MALSLLAYLKGVKTHRQKSSYTYVEKSERRPQPEHWAIANHPVTLPDHTLYLSDQPVTFEEFYLFVKATGYKTYRERHNQSPTWLDVRGPTVLWITQEDALAFCSWLSAVRHHPFRLPTADEVQASPLKMDLWECSSDTLNGRYETTFKADEPLRHRRACDTPCATFRVAWDLL